MSSPRRLREVEWAHECEAPAFAQKRRLRGTKALGVSYERKLSKVLPRGTLHGPWFIYRADGRVGYCQPDFLLRGRSELAVLEAKLTDFEQAREQLINLYTPVLEVFYKPKRILRVAVIRSVARLEPGIKACATLSEALAMARISRVGVLHWIGTGGL